MANGKYKAKRMRARMHISLHDVHLSHALVALLNEHGISTLGDLDTQTNAELQQSIGLSDKQLDEIQKFRTG